MPRHVHNAQVDEVRISTEGVELPGDRLIPEHPRGLVLFAHGSGSSRFSSRNRFVAQRLNEAGLATLLMDLLTPEEEAVDAQTADLRFDIPMLARRLVAAVDSVLATPATRSLPVGLFGASTGGGAALVAAAQRPRAVAAVVSRGGRPDLAEDALRYVRAPTLLIVGGEDSIVIHLNQQAMRQMVCRNRLEIVPAAGHLFEEPGALEQVARLAGEWFRSYLDTASSPPARI
jgi:putative phosphoribosyl transferase